MDTNPYGIGFDPLASPKRSPFSNGASCSAMAGTSRLDDDLDSVAGYIGHLAYTTQDILTQQKLLDAIQSNVVENPPTAIPADDPVPIARLWWNQVYTVVAKGLKSGADVLKVDADTVYTSRTGEVEPSRVPLDSPLDESFKVEGDSPCSATSSRSSRSLGLQSHSSIGSACDTPICPSEQPSDLRKDIGEVYDTRALVAARNAASAKMKGMFASFKSSLSISSTEDVYVQAVAPRPPAPTLSTRPAIPCQLEMV